MKYRPAPGHQSERGFELMTVTLDDGSSTKPVLLQALQRAHSAGEIHSRLEVLTTEGGKMKRLMVVAVLLTVASLLWEPGLHAQAASSGQASTSSKDNQASIDQSVALLRQATKFWPVYDQYSKLGDQRYALIKEYAKGFGTLTDDQALSLIKRSLSLDEQVAQLRSKYVPIINQVLPGTKTATFFQMDRYINSLIDVQLAGAIPLAQEQK